MNRTCCGQLIHLNDTVLYRCKYDGKITIIIGNIPPNCPNCSRPITGETIKHPKLRTIVKTEIFIPNNGWAEWKNYSSKPEEEEN